MMCASRIGAWAKSGGGSRLPYPYEEHKYLYSDGSAYTIIPHTHVNAQNIEIKTSILALDEYVIGGKNIFQGAVSDRSWMGGFYGNNSTTSGFYCANIAGGHNLNFNISRSWSVQIVRNGGICVLKRNDIEETLTLTSNMTLAQMGLFTQTNGSIATTGRAPKNVCLGEFIYKDGTSYSADLVPCKNILTNECGFYDLYNSYFLGNANLSGVFNVYDNEFIA